MTGVNRSVVWRVLAGSALALWLVLLPQAALAHASLLGSDPENGEQLDAVPARVSLEFTESMASPATIVVTGPDGESATSGEPKVADTMVTQALADGAGAGTYTVAYRVFSEDGHEVSGQLTFEVLGDPETPGTGQPTATPSDTESSAPTSGQTTDQATGPTEATSAGKAASGTSRWSGRWLEVGVAVALFLGAGLLWGLSRRA